MDEKSGIEVRIGDRVVGHITSFRPAEPRDKMKTAYTLPPEKEGLPCVICGKDGCRHLEAPQVIVLERPTGFIKMMKSLITEIAPADMENVLRASEQKISMGCEEKKHERSESECKSGDEDQGQ